MEDENISKNGLNCKRKEFNEEERQDELIWTKS